MNRERKLEIDGQAKELTKEFRDNASHGDTNQLRQKTIVKTRKNHL